MNTYFKNITKLKQPNSFKKIKNKMSNGYQLTMDTNIKIK